VRVVDTRVDDPDLDVLTGQTKVLPHSRGTQERHRVSVGWPEQLHVTHRFDAGQRGEPRDVPGLDLDGNAVVGVLDLGQDFAAEVDDVGGDSALPRPQVATDRGSLPVRQLVTLLGRTRLADGHGRPLDLHDDREQSVRLGQLRRQVRVDALTLRSSQRDPLEIVAGPLGGSDRGYERQQDDDAEQRCSCTSKHGTSTRQRHGERQGSPVTPENDWDPRPSRPL